MQIQGDGGASVPEERTAAQKCPVRSPRRRAPREELAALGTRQMRQQDEDSVLLGGPGRDPVPLGQVGRARPGGLVATRRRRAAAQKKIGAVERQDRRGHRVPQILADQHAHPAEARPECVHLAARLHEPGLLEDSVGGQEDLAVDVDDLVPAVAGCQVRHAVAHAGPAPLVEADHHVAVASVGGRAERIQQPPRRKGDFERGPLDEVPGEHRLGKDRDVGAWHQSFTYSRDVGLHIALAGFDLAEYGPERTLFVHAIP